MGARSERAPRECLILRSAQTLVGPVSVSGSMFGQCRSDTIIVAHPGDPVCFIRPDRLICTVGDRTSDPLACLCLIGQARIVGFSGISIVFRQFYQNKASPRLLA